MKTYEDGLLEAWNAVDAIIRRGHLPEPAHTERNGMVFACNAIAALLGWGEARYAEDLPAPVRH